MTYSFKTLLTRSALSSCAAFLLLLTPAKAVTITLNSVDYDVQSVTPGLSPVDFQATLESQAWWGNAALAQSAAEQVGTQLGFPRGGFEGPLFVYAIGGYGYWYAYVDDSASGVGAIPINGAYNGLPFAVATPSAVPDSTSSGLALGIALVGLASLRRKLARD